MRTSTVLFVAAAALSCATLAVSPARAQGIYWVANSGADVNPCSFASPCLTFQHVHNTFVAGSEVRCKEPGDYGGVSPLNILQSFTFNCEDNIASIKVPIAVSTGVNDVVVLRGVALTGFRFSYGCCFVAGVNFINGGGVLVLHKVSISGFQGGAGGLRLTPNANARLIVLDSKIYDNGSGGNVLIQPTAGAAVQATFENSFIAGSVFGIKADGSGQATGQIDVDVRNSQASHNINNGFIAVSGAGQAPVHFMIEHSTAYGNGAFGAVASGAQAFMIVNNSVLAKNGTGLAQQSGSTVATYSNNGINFNTTNTSGTITAIALK